MQLCKNIAKFFVLVLAVMASQPALADKTLKLGTTGRLGILIGDAIA